MGVQFLMPMLRILLGLAAVGAIGLVGIIFFDTPARIQADIEARTTQLARDAGADWLKIIVDGRRILLSGEAPSTVSAGEIVSALKKAPGVSQVDATNVKLAPPPRPAPSPWRASFEEGVLTISGDTPTKEAREIVMDVAQSNFSNAAIVDAMSVDERLDEAPWLKTSSSLLGALSLLREGSSTIDQEKASISGVAETIGARRTVDALVEQVGKNRELTVEVSIEAETGVGRSVVDGAETFTTVRDSVQLADARARECQRRIDFAMTGNQVTFPSGSDGIGRGVQRLLAELSEVISACGDVEVAIYGHTDISGDENRNQALSSRRAAAVHGFLVDVGVGSARLTSEGFGSSKPVASNATVAGRARNRRIDFVVRPVLAEAADATSPESD